MITVEWHWGTSIILGSCLWLSQACTFPERNLAISGHLVGLCGDARISALRKYGDRVDTMGSTAVDADGHFDLQVWTTLSTDPTMQLLLERQGLPDRLLSTVSVGRGRYLLAESIAGDSTCAN